MPSRPLQVGISIIPDTGSLDRSRELVWVAEEGGLTLVGVQDHPYQHHFFDTWSLIPTLLAETKRISSFTDVASLPLRPLAVMAKAAASLDVLSGGRLRARPGWRRTAGADRELRRPAAHTGRRDRRGGDARRPKLARGRPVRPNGPGPANDA